MREAAIVLVLAALTLAEDTAAIHGRVRKADATPWADVVVTAYLISGEELIKRTVRTDHSGNYRLGDLPAGKYVISLPASRRTPRRPRPRLPQEAIRDTSSEDLLDVLDTVLWRTVADPPSRLVDVPAGEVVRLDIQMPKCVPVTIKVKHKGRPIPGAVVRLSRLVAPGEVYSTVARRGTPPPPRTDRRGLATLKRVAAGPYGLDVRFQGWKIECGSIEVGEEACTVPIEFGRASMRLRVLDGLGKPATGVSLGVFPEERDRMGVSAKAGKIQGTGGIYTVPYLHSGLHTVWARSESAYATMNGALVDPEARVATVTLRLPPTGTVSVRVVDGSGEPVANAQIGLRHSNGTAGYSRQSDEQGTLRLELAVGIWIVGVQDTDLSVAGILRRHIDPKREFVWRGEPREVAVRPVIETVVTVEAPGDP